MKYFLQFIVLSIAATIYPTMAAAEELKVDLGNFPARPCMKSADQGNLGMRQEFSPRIVQVTAKIFIDPSNPKTIAVVQACAEKAKEILSENKSSSNLRLFEETFQQYLSQCTREANAGIRLVQSVLSSNSTCKGGG